jgi:Fe2+ transport system protein FeoA
MHAHAPDTPPVAVPLTSLAAGTTCTLHAAHVDRGCSELLRALGLTERSRVRLCKVGEPCIVQVRATRIGLSRLVADAIYVLPHGGA